MRILVTGGAGFIGSHVVNKLIKEKQQVVVLDDLSGGLREHLPADAAFVQLDVRNAAAQDYIAEGHFDAIIHLAAQTMVDASIREPQMDEQVNIGGVVNVLEGARRGGVRRVLFSSSAAVYGDAADEDLPIREEHLLEPLSFYGLSKLTTESYLALYHRYFGMEYVVFRFANVYGERQGNGGEGGVISIFCKKLAAHEGITIFGNGLQTRDFVYAGDVANALWQGLMTDHPNTVYNISTQTETSLIELVSILNAIAGTKCQTIFAPPRAGDIFRSVLNCRKAREKLPWQPEMSIHEGLQRTYTYFKQFMNKA